MSESQQSTTASSTPVSADDPLFGEITVELDDGNGSLAVHGGGDVPRVVRCSNCGLDSPAR